MNGVKILEAKISTDLFNEVDERVRLGLFSTRSEVVNKALGKAFAEDSREYLRRFIKKSGISEKAMIKEWKNIRN